MTFLKASQLAGVQKYANRAMTTPVDIYRRATTETATGSQDTWNLLSSTTGWLFSHPSPVITVVSGAMALVNTYRLFVPVGTDIDSGDHVIIGGNRFTVSDTVAESTYLPLLAVSLRRVE